MGGYSPGCIGAAGGPMVDGVTLLVTLAVFALGLVGAESIRRWRLPPPPLPPPHTEGSSSPTTPDGLGRLLLDDIQRVLEITRTDMDRQQRELGELRRQLETTQGRLSVLEARDLEWVKWEVD